MAGVVTIIEKLSESFGSESNLTFTLLFFTAVIALYSVFVYYFYRFLAKKNIIELNLNQYNRYENETTVKLFAMLFYVVEYIVLLPILTFFWFTILSILILVLAEGLSVSTILLISAALVASVRVTSYVSQNLAKDLAKMLPFTLLAIAITKPGFFEVSSLITRIAEIPGLFSNIPYYLIFIVAIELIMRLVEFIQNIFSPKEEEEEEE